jgi:hypothetical protein
MNSESRRIIISGSIIKYPWGGLIQYWITWITGLKMLGHDVYYVEDEEWDYACYDIGKRAMTSDPSYGISVVKKELEYYQLGDHWCYVGRNERFYGLSKSKLEELFKTADIFIDIDYDSLKPYSLGVPLRIYIDGEPGWNQIGIKKLENQGKDIPKYNAYFTYGLNIGKENAFVPDLDIDWQNMFCPVLLYKSYNKEINKEAAFTTVMQWKANPALEFEGKNYGMKDFEFQKFIQLPKLTNQKMEIVASGPNVPRELLAENGWVVKDGDEVSTSTDNYRKFISSSKGEFSVVKNVFVETNCGIFMERSGYYMFSNRPVVLQDTGWSAHLPTGRGLFAVNTVEEAADAIKMIGMDYRQHSVWAQEIVHEYLDATKVLGAFMEKIEYSYSN